MLGKKYSFTLFLIAYFTFCAVFFSFFASGGVDSQDGMQYLAISRRMVYDHTFEMPVEKYPEANIHLSGAGTADGKWYSPTGLGFSLALIPAVLVEKLLLNITQLQPISAFPLISDWPVNLFASMTNSVFGALICVTLLLYFHSFKISLRTATILSFTLFTASNLLPYAKYVFAHEMFVSFLFLTFYFVHRYGQTSLRRYLLQAGMTYGVVVLSYNPTFILALPALGIYGLFQMDRVIHRTFKSGLLSKKTWQNHGGMVVKMFGLNIGTGLLGVLPFLLTYSWFNSVRFGNLAKSGYGPGGYEESFIPPAYVIFEGMWNLLFSAGKSVFLYSPPLVLLVLFWHKLPKKFLPEIISFGLLSLIYWYFIGTLQGSPGFLVWHGDSSWGPRYVLPVLPGLLLLVGILILELTKLQRKLFAIPIFLLGFWIQLCGVLLPYQIRFGGLQVDAMINGLNFTVFEYGNMFPRYSPAFVMSKKLVRRLIEVPQMYDRGEYNLYLLDGFERPFWTGVGTWREILPKTVIKFDAGNPQLDQISLQLKNHQLDPESSRSAQLRASLNGKPVELKNNLIGIDQEKTLELTLAPEQLLPRNNYLLLEPSFVGTDSARLRFQQVLFLQKLSFNGKSQNLRLMDFPRISPISQKLTGVEYTYWGGQEKNPWDIWHMHSGVYEETFDLWWLKPFHYWDLPKGFFYGVFAGNLIILSLSGMLVFMFLSETPVTAIKKKK